MAGNAGMFVDRSPSILPAGLKSTFSDGVSDCMREYTLANAEDALRYVAGQKTLRNDPSKYKMPPYTNSQRRGIYTEIRHVLQPPVRTPFQTLINELKETSYDSHWNKVVGRVRDPVPSLPKGMKPLEVTFGKPTPKTDGAKELINPSKSVYQVLTEGQVGHELYKKTHNDYNCGEHIDRNYLKPPYVPDKRFGKPAIYDPRGIWVRCACHWHMTEPVTHAHRIQVEHEREYQPKLGKGMAPNRIKEMLGEYHTYGDRSKRELYGVNELLKDNDCPPCVFKKDFLRWMESWNKLAKYMNEHINMKELFRRLMHYDPEHSGTLPLPVFYQVCHCYNVGYDYLNFEPLLRLLSVLIDDKIDYKGLFNLLDCRTEPVQLVKIPDIPERNLYYVTSYQAACCDRFIINNAVMKAAGVPSVRYDLDRPIVPPNECRVALENLGDETALEILINPSVYANYGLSYRDFFAPRSQETIKKMFENVGYQFSDETFAKFWQMGVDNDRTGLVCVDTFYNLLKAHYPEKRRIVVDEATC